MKIVIIKLGALGDVVRTLPLAKAIKTKHKSSKLYWITKKESLELFENNPYVDKVFILPYKGKEHFDILYNFDIDDEVTSLAKSISADKKYGFYKEGDYPSSFNLGAEYYLNTLFDDQLKRENRKTYQEMMFEAAELPYSKEPPEIYLTEKDIKYSQDFIKKYNIKTENLIGIHMGASQRWPSKAWSKEKLKEFIILAKNKGYEIILFAGPDEIKKQSELIKELEQEKIKVYTNNPNNTKREFVSLVNICKKIVCSDSLALHIALALKKPTIGLFFCTTPYEVEGYGLLKKIISPLFNKYFPEKQDQYIEELVNSIPAQEILDAIED